MRIRTHRTRHRPIDWFFRLGDQYGVDPIIFACIYIGSIPLFTFAMGWLVRRMLHGRTFLLPATLATVFYTASYAYVFVMGRGIPWWVYALLLSIMCTSGYFTIQNIRARASRMSPKDCTHDVVVLGGGAAGLTAAGIAASLGAKTALIERGPLGGDCTWHGCVPSKTLLKSAKIAHHVRHASRYGLIDQPAKLDFGAVMEHLRTVRQEVYDEADDPSIYEAMGVDVISGDARFLDEHRIEIARDDGHTQRVSARYIIIAAGASAAAPPIDGLEDVDYLTSETLFDLDTLPERLAIVGAGPIGTEMAQAFQRLGAQVTVLDRSGRILAKDDPELAEMLRQTLQKEGVEYVFGADVKRVAQPNGTIQIEVEQNGEARTLEADALLLATGRAPNMEGLRLEAAGVERTKEGITVSDRCRTSQRHIYAIGDVTGRYQFTHMSEHMAKVATTNALLKVPMKIDDRHVPWVTYADPELAHVGATEAQLQEKGARYEVYRFPYSKLDRALTESETTGLVKVYATKWTGRILGASILGERAGDLICEYALAMKNGVTLRQIADTIHPYPSYGLGVRRAADQWYAEKQRPALIRLIQRVFGYRGEIIEPDPDRIV